MKIIFNTLFTLALFISANCLPLSAQKISNKKANGYKAIWFELNQKYTYGDKYSGALGTYTAKHTPLAIYAPEVQKTFFVYGGTSAENARHLLCMIGEFDHTTGMVSKPTIVHDKQGVDDPHDNPSICIDDKGFIWVFVSGRGTARPGFKYKSLAPYSTDSFVQVTEEEMTYPQPHFTKDGFFHFFTKYSGVRQLYFETSTDGEHWTEDRQLAAIPEKEGEKSGHYQTSNVYQNKTVGTFFNRHPNGNVDQRTDLYFLKSNDFGRTWTNVDGRPLQIPIKEKDSPARAINYAKQHKNVYLKDMGFDDQGNPACLYIRSNGHKPGPESEPYEWCLTKWDGKKWQTSVITSSDHNYDMGSLYISKGLWQIVGPTEIGPQKWGVGGELAIWQSKDEGKNWTKQKVLTQNSTFNHSYVRRPKVYQSPFSFFWADGHAHEFSKSELYFGDFDGRIWKLPYEMTASHEKPIRIK
ncbi:BNR repeat-containing protein [Marinilongibacter aquaticus]|uniref:BNR repeat-containing protein n=1 Tax=Marinilongibacter aquaticus TaxID=2975157 RepID=UPI0021BD2C0D|nr:BNR repeat-containing protein [Marinilongibacter aquaticus]UBM58997.1 BNR repeat-containing protein [Marinilongibacter aquaticus]